MELGANKFGKGKGGGGWSRRDPKLLDDMLAEHSIWAVHKDRPRLHSKETRWGIILRASWIPQRFQLYEPLQTVSSVVEVCRKCRLSLVLTFVDYEKISVRRPRSGSYVRTLADCYKNCSIMVHLKRAQQGDPYRQSWSPLRYSGSRSHLSGTKDIRVD